MMTVMWAAFFLGALFIEAQTAELLAVWFVPGALVALVLATCGVPTWIQWIAFAAISVVLVVLALTIFRKKLLKNYGKEKTDIDLLEFLSYIVLEKRFGSYKHKVKLVFLKRAHNLALSLYCGFI
jgi:membrane protein implicated in regulation of membrane protease activity